MYIATGSRARVSNGDTSGEEQYYPARSLGLRYILLNKGKQNLKLS
jgi:hypothetical protein